MGTIKAKTHLEKLGFSETDKKKPKHDPIQTWVYENIKQIISETVMKDSSALYEVLLPQWEAPVPYQNGSYITIVGFIDIMVHLKGKFYNRNSLNNDRMEPYMAVFIEVKTEIPSLGELIRQMRAYQFYRDLQDVATSYIIVSPDDSHKKILVEQGFYFYKYKDPSLLF
jgi:hypothetical protein